MHLSKPSFPISFKLEDVTALIESLLKEKYWKKFEVASLQLIFEPYFIFYYDSFTEAADEETGERAVSGTERGRLALHAVDAEIDAAVADSMPDESELVRKISDKYPAEVRKPAMNENEAAQIAQIKTAESLGIARNNVVISNLQLVYYPMWYVDVSVASATYELQVSAVTGEVFGESEIPERKKGFIEITQETLQELKKPSAWLKYSSEIAGSTARIVANPGIWRRIVHALLHNRNAQISLLLLAILVIILVYLY